MLKIFNTLNDKIEEFKPLLEDEVSIYVCGITLYDDIHIGHLKSIISFEVLRNYFEFKGFKVNLVRNITDVDDKIIAKAVKENEDPLLLVNKYINTYHQLLQDLEIRPPSIEPRVTDYLDKIEQYISSLENKGFAYKASDGVYFDTTKLNQDKYPLSKKIVADLNNETRMDKSFDRKNKSDFALWKKDTTYGYFSRLLDGKGRPGWHIECSVMHHHTLGQRFDIHGGGRDLIFPHHENEIIQSIAHNGINPANYWIHNGMMMKNGKKLSKSEGNSIYVKDLIKKYSPQAIKLFLSKSNYRQAQEYSEEDLAIENQRLILWVEQIIDAKEAPFESFKDKFIQALEEDLNTPLALSYVFKAMKEFNQTKSKGLAQEILNALKLLNVYKSEETLDSIYETYMGKQPPIPHDIQLLIDKRNEAKNSKNYALADSLRDQLNTMGWILEDKKTTVAIKPKRN